MYVVSVVAAAGVCCLAVLVFAFTRRAAAARGAFLKGVAESFGCAHHGSSFRGRYRSRAVRGDTVDRIPRRTLPAGARPLDGLMTSVGLGALMALRAIGGALHSSATGTPVLRLRIELCAQGQPLPDGARATTAVRKDLKGRFTDPASYELATIGGTELVVILRADAANAQTARSVVDLAISSCAPAPASGPGA